MDEKEAEARPVMGTIFLVDYLCVLWGTVLPTTDNFENLFSPKSHK